MRILLTLYFVAWAVIAHATTVLKEDFNTLKNGTTYTGEVSLPSGTRASAASQGIIVTGGKKMIRRGSQL